MLDILRDSRSRARLLWPATLALAVFAYLYHFDGFYAPRIGDESPYIQIVRLTAKSGQWLPLETAPGLENTKPPFLFWLGMISTHWAQNWSLFHLRLPIVVVTCLTAGIVFWLAHRITGDRECGFFSAIAFLGFRSTFQYGRPFLTNLPETLFVFLPFALVVGFRNRVERWGLGFWVVQGMLLGVACLFKSFVLVVPVGFGFMCLFLVERRWDLASFLRKDALKIGTLILVALLCFALWPALDPEPGSVIRQFVLEENVGKLGGTGYFSGLVTGPYAAYRIWLAPFASTGLFALPLLYVLVRALKRREDLSFEERSLWVVTLSFLIVYTFPSQRQENYLLPVTPALAVLLALHWKEIPQRWFYLFQVPLALGLVLLYRLMFEVSQQVGGYAMWHLLVPALGLGATALGLILIRLSRYTFPVAVFFALLSLTCFLAPFDGSRGRFEPDRVELLKGKTIYVPSSFIGKYERHRFLLPRSRIEGYEPEDVEVLNKLLGSRKYVAVQRDFGQQVEGPYRIFARRLDLRTRQPLAELARIVFEKDITLLIQQELIVRRQTVRRERGGVVSPR